MQPEIEEAEEEDEVTEEDLRRAEEEFLHGPMGNTDLNPEDDTEGTESQFPAHWQQQGSYPPDSTLSLPDQKNPYSVSSQRRYKRYKGC